MYQDPMDGDDADSRLLAWARSVVDQAQDHGLWARREAILAVAAVARGRPDDSRLDVPPDLHRACRRLTGQALGALYEGLLGGGARETADRKSRGAFFTPPQLVCALLDRALEPLLQECSVAEDVLRLRVLDPTMGAGTFLIEALARMVQRCQRLGGADSTWRRCVATQCLFGMDIDSLTSEVARAALAIECPGLAPAELAAHLVHGDALSDSLPGPARFDLIVGNPPWRKAKLSAVEHFRGRDGTVAEAQTAARRAQMIQTLGACEAEGFTRAYTEALERMRWYRESGRYPLSATGDVNLYALVLERTLQLLKPHGMAGLLVPTGIATDHGTRRLFGHLLEHDQLHQLLDFDNRGGVFPGIHREERFCLLVFGGTHRTRERVRCAFELRGMGDVPAHSLDIDRATLSRLNPHTGSLAIIRSRTDLRILDRMHRAAPPLLPRGGSHGGQWGVRYVRMFDMSRDSGLFHWGPGASLVPLYEGKMIALYDHRHASIRSSSERCQSRSAAEPAPESFKEDPAFAPRPRYWVPLDEARRRAPVEPWHLAFRDIANPNNERTLIVTAVPGGVACGNTLPLLSPACQGGQWHACLLANLASMAIDYVVRAKAASRHANWYMVRQLPVLPPARFDDPVLRQYIVDRVLALCYTAHDLAPMAVDLGLPTGAQPQPYRSEERRHLRAELDALFMVLYGLSTADVEHILTGFGALRRSEERAYREYLSRRLILESLDAARALVG